MRQSQVKLEKRDTLTGDTHPDVGEALELGAGAAGALQLPHPLLQPPGRGLLLDCHPDPVSITSLTS